MFNIETLRSKSLPELTKISKDLGVKIPKSSTKDEVVFAILDFQASNPKPTKEYYNATETTMEKTLQNQQLLKLQKRSLKLLLKRKQKNQQNFLKRPLKLQSKLKKL